MKMNFDELDGTIIPYITSCVKYLSEKVLKSSQLLEENRHG